MKVGQPSSSFEIFFYSIFSENVALRRRILAYWLAHVLSEKQSERHAHCIRERLLEPILFGRVALVMQHETFSFFVGAPPLRYDWLTAEQRAFVVEQLYLPGQQLFDECKRQDRVFVMSKFAHDNALTLCSGEWRRVLARDLALLLTQLGQRMEMIAATQTILLNPHSNNNNNKTMMEFVISLHGAVQKDALHELTAVVLKK